MRSILLHIHDDEAMEARFQAALDVARRFDSHITCLQAVPYEFGMPGDLYFSLAMDMAASFRANADRFQKEIENRLTGEGVRWDWVRTKGDAVDEIDHLAPLSDMVILGSRNPVGDARQPSRLGTEAVVGVKAPVLVVPPSATGLALDAPAVVAWNGSSESAHALQAAQPILSAASEVHIFAVREKTSPDRRGLSTSEAAKFLARHDIEPLITELAREGETSIAATLIDAAKIRKAGVVIMGAYGRSRFRERLLGGVTRDMLSDPPIPLLLSH